MCIVFIGLFVQLAATENVHTERWYRKSFCKILRFDGMGLLYRAISYEQKEVTETDHSGP